jgi:VWFA-related protein
MARFTLRVRPLMWSTTAVVAAAGFAASIAVLQAQGGQPTFRSAVDLIAVDVQVVDSDGLPIANLTPEHFDVSIGGRRRRVVSAEYVEHVEPRALSTQAAIRGPVARNIWPAGPSSGPRRLFMVAVDVLSFSATASRGASDAARRFVSGLEPHDLVGVYAYPLGPMRDPTTDHAAVEQALSQIVGQRQVPYSRFHLTLSEVIDITSDMNRASRSIERLTADEMEQAVAEVALRECGRTPRCSSSVRAEAVALANYYEAQATASLNSLSRLIEAMASHPGRKTMILLSAGMASSDRPGGRPDVTGLARRLGQAAAAGNVTLYVLHVDGTYMNALSSETGRVDRSEIERESTVFSRWLSEFSGASGGALMPVLTGWGETAFDRILRETSAYYLLGVEPGESDRTGRTQMLRVNVNGHDDATVRSRTLVVIPPRAD